MAAVASIVIEIDESKALASINRISDAVRDVDPAYQKLGQTSNKVMNDVVREQERAMDAAAALGDELEDLPDRFGGIGSAIATAFGISAIGLFTAAVTNLPQFIDNVAESLTHWKENTAMVARETENLNEILSAHQEHLAALQLGYEQIGLHGADLLAKNQEIANRKLDEAKQSFDDAAGAMDAYTGKMFKNAELARNSAEGSDKMQVSLADVVDGMRKSDPEWGRLNENLGKARVGLEDAEQAARAAHKTLITGQDEVAKHVATTTARIKEQRDAFDSFGANTREMLNTMSSMQTGEVAAAALDQINQADIASRNAVEEAARKANDKFMQDQQRAAEEFAHKRQEMANSLASFFDDITTGHTGQRFRRMFQQLVAGMVADWVMGVQQMGAASSAGMGGGQAGGVRGVLGSVFGSGGAVGTPPFVADGSSIAGTPLSAGGAVNVSTALPAGASIMTGGSGVSAVAPLGFLGRTGLGGILSQVGTTIGAASMLGFGSPARGAVSGAATALLGSSAVAAAFPSTIPFLAALGVPVIGAIGAGIGLLIGALGNSKRASQRHDLEMQELDNIKKVLEQYQNHLGTYDQAENALEHIRQQYSPEFVKLKGDPHGFVDSHIDIAEGQLSGWEQTRQAEAQRIADEQARRAGLQFGPPMFRNGGLVDMPMRFGSGGEVPAILHAGEFVMRPEAVRQQGVAKLKAMNDGRSSAGSGGDTYHVSISAIDARGFDQYLRNGGLNTIKRNISIARTEGRW